MKGRDYRVTLKGQAAGKGVVCCPVKLGCSLIIAVFVKSLYLLVKSQSHQVITEDKLEVDLEEDASSCRYASCPAHFKTPYDATGYAQLNFEYIH